MSGVPNDAPCFPQKLSRRIPDFGGSIPDSRGSPFDENNVNTPRALSQTRKPSLERLLRFYCGCTSTDHFFSTEPWPVLSRRGKHGPGGRVLSHENTGFIPRLQEAASQLGVRAYRASHGMNPRSQKGTGPEHRAPSSRPPLKQATPARGPASPHYRWGFLKLPDRGHSSPPPFWN